MREVFLTPRLVLTVAVLILSVHSQLRAQEQDVPEQKADAPTSRQSAADSVSNYRQLLANLQRIVASPILKKAKQSVAVYSLDRQKMVFEHNSHTALTPASTTKLFFAYAAMKLLGADYGVPTQIAYDGTIGKDSVLNGNVYLIGHGDCLLGVSDIEALAERVRRAGIKAIKGDVVADASFFDNLTDRQAYSGDRERMESLAPISALGINRNQVTVLVSASSRGVAHAQTVPQSQAFKVTLNGPSSEAPSEAKKKTSATTLTPEAKVSPKITTPIRPKDLKHPLPRPKAGPPKKHAAAIRRGRRHVQPAPKKSAKRRKSHALLFKSSSENVESLSSWTSSQDLVEQTAGDIILRRHKARRAAAPAKNRVVLRVNTVLLRDGVQEFVVSGNPAPNSTSSYSYEIRNPALAATGIFFRSLLAEGIKVEGSIRTGSAGPQAKVVAEVRRPLTELLLPVNKNSDNFVAEHVMKIVGATCCGNNQCNVHAFQTISAILDSAKIPLDGCQLFDGSGLSRRNKTSAATQLLMLKAISEQPFSSVFYNTMAIAGVDGTLHKRMVGTNAQGNVRAKTGTHNNVSALSGYVRTRDGERLCFSIITNGAGVGGFKQLENAIAVQLAEFSFKDGTIAVPSLR